MLNRLLVTGAAGGLGQALRPHLGRLARHVRLSDVAELPGGSTADNEEVVRADLADGAAVMRLVDGCDGILHLGGVSVERSWQEILPANIMGTYHLYEAARQQQCSRIVFASSNHAIGFYPRTERLDARVPHKPDSLYGVSKCFGEDLASLYFDKFGVETLAVRIGSCFPEPADTRMLATWMSVDDFVALLERAFVAPKLGYTVVYGASNNAEQWWDNREAGFLGWVPKDSSEPWRAQTEAREGRLDPNDPAVRFQGGKFTAQGHPDD
ncbi:MULTISPECIES: NAD-dependent epimerase/dehydratase family protein [Halomonas]|uniref:NAD-dependent epimerase/dehydratase family protein n=1 Tax=Halomonas TaxID=2745 RepID=UPI001A8D2E50|nr:MULTISPECIES: NAD(P)-dependent oxidoreductase [Halomonas]MED5296163.1 NAD(P)-dependent oxidoreductase [Pseudomonadota bacterium]MBN8411255.1 NAD(P)-dependent oxidoreductase [Halomonas litopenaei]MBY5927609.1 NAD(P)-dependent oxidoreductase [Halomonas sp. DP8Y7-3]MBY5985369.1 NAD(P)-dependent oxidoreductase [Halomonas sp. DP5Y7-2]MBY6029729.1 NAD(P)-dependent oxidoreductase [Halomonas sp. DP8Y7-1]